MKSAVVFLCLVGMCVASRQGRIVGGSDAQLYTHAHQASLQYNTTDNGWFHICGAVLISDRKLVTAAHCIDGLAISRLRIVVGALRLDEVTPYQQSRSLSSAVMHQQYRPNGRGFPNDIAVLHLSSPVSLNNNVQPAELAPTGSSFADEECIISGWGRFDSNSNAGAVHLQEAKMTKITNSLCSAYWGSSINSNHICIFAYYVVGGTRPSSCNGDSGGPLMCGLNKEYLAGVTSWGVTTCSGDYPSVYTRTSNYNSWIAAN